MKKIPLTQNQFTLVDDADFEWLNHYKWYALNNHRGSYVAARMFWAEQQTILMHRQILGLVYGDGKQGDHKDHNTLNNQRHNLRSCTNSENQMNSNKHKDNTSGYKGVGWFERDKKWRARIQLNNKAIHLGYFRSKIKAANAYDQKAKELFGEFAWTSFV